MAQEESSVTSLGAGQREGQENIIGGTKVPFGKYPSYAIPDLTRSFLCGASLIWKDILLTAGHCTVAFGNPTKGVFIGGIKLDGTDAPEQISVKSLLVHPSFNFPHNDIMLVVLAQPSNALVAKWNANPNVPIDNEVVTAYGFGRAINGDPSSLSPDLLEVVLNIVNFDTCKAATPAYGDLVKAESLCAGNKGKVRAKGTRAARC